MQKTPNEGVIFLIGRKNKAIFGFCDKRYSVFQWCNKKPLFKSNRSNLATIPPTNLNYQTDVELTHEDTGPDLRKLPVCLEST